MSSALAYPPSRSRIASSVAAKRMRLTMNPQISFCSSTGVRPMLRTNSIAASTVSAEVFGPRTTSHSCMTVTGWKKCMLQHISGRPLTSASRLIAMVLELLARIAVFFACLPSASNTLFLASKFSITASITRSAEAAAVARSLESAMRASAWSACSLVSLPFSTERSTSLRFWARALSSWPSTVSTRVTSWRPPNAVCSASCEPMVPAPTTSTRFNSCRRVSMKQFEDAAQAAIDSIPEEFQPYLENTVFLVEEQSPDGLMGLYEGAGALGAGEGLPERITLYKRSHEEPTHTMAELVEEVRRTILHEVGHHFGMDEDDLPY